MCSGAGEVASAAAHRWRRCAVVISRRAASCGDSLARASPASGASCPGRGPPPPSAAAPASIPRTPAQQTGATCVLKGGLSWAHEHPKSTNSAGWPGPSSARIAPVHAATTGWTRPGRARQESRTRRTAIDVPRPPSTHARTLERDEMNARTARRAGPLRRAPSRPSQLLRVTVTMVRSTTDTHHHLSCRLSWAAAAAVVRAGRPAGRPVCACGHHSSSWRTRTADGSSLCRLGEACVRACVLCLPEQLSLA